MLAATATATTRSSPPPCSPLRSSHTIVVHAPPMFPLSVIVDVSFAFTCHALSSVAFRLPQLVAPHPAVDRVRRLLLRRRRLGDVELAGRELAFGDRLPEQQASCPRVASLARFPPAPRSRCPPCPRPRSLPRVPAASAPFAQLTVKSVMPHVSSANSSGAISRSVFAPRTPNARIVPAASAAIPSQYRHRSRAALLPPSVPGTPAGAQPPLATASSQSARSSASPLGDHALPAPPRVLFDLSPEPDERPRGRHLRSAPFAPAPPVVRLAEALVRRAHARSSPSPSGSKRPIAQRAHEVAPLGIGLVGPDLVPHRVRPPAAGGERRADLVVDPVDLVVATRSCSPRGRRSPTGSAAPRPRPARRRPAASAGARSSGSALQPLSCRLGVRSRPAVRLVEGPAARSLGLPPCSSWRRPTPAAAASRVGQGACVLLPRAPSSRL